MAARRKWRLRAAMLSLALVLVLGVTPLLTATVSSAPLGQEQPGEDVYLDYDDVVTKTLTGHDASDVFQAYVFRLHVPAGSKLTVWLREDTQGGCYSEGLLFVDGSQVGRTTVGPEPSSWSDPIVASVGPGYAQLSFRAYDDCDASVTFPVRKYVRFQVQRSGEVITVPTPAIDFWAERTTIVRGECTALHWRVENVQEVYYQGESVPSDGDRQECPQDTTTYELYVVIREYSGSLEDETWHATVHVEEPDTPTHIPTRTPTRTPIPTRSPTRTRTPTPTQRATRSPTTTPIPTPSSPPTPQVDDAKLLVVTHSSRLDSMVKAGMWYQVRYWLALRYGEEGYHVLDLADYPAEAPDHCAALPFPEQCAVDLYIDQEWPRGRYWAIFIIGGHGIVPQAVLPNPAAGVDGDLLFTDDLYADVTGDWIPDTPLARLPDGRDGDLLQTQLTRSRGIVAANTGFVMANKGWNYADQLAEAVGTTAVYSPPFDRSQGAPPGLDSAFTYFDVDGAMMGTPPLYNRAWWGSDRDTGEGGFLALTALDANSKGVVVTTASYGALAGCLSPECTDVWGTMPIQFLVHGARAYIGTTVQNYRIPVITKGEEHCTLRLWPPGRDCRRTTIEQYAVIGPGIPTFTKDFLDSWQNGADPLLAYYRSKAGILRSTYAMAGMPNSHLILKMAHGLVYYGVPAPLGDNGCSWCSAEQHCPSGDETDCDGDGLADELEYGLVETFKPVLIFDTREPQAARNGLQTYWQVTPAKLDGVNGVFLTMIMAWPYDYGSQEWKSANPWSIVFCSIGDAVADFNYASKHCGDTEGIRFFIAFNGDSWTQEEIAVSSPGPPDWELTHIDWKRHTEEKFGDPVPVSAHWQLRFTDQHPRVIVSGHKHAMYPNIAECEAFEHEELGGLCAITFEQCDPGEIRRPYTPREHNVGEQRPVGYPLLDYLPGFDGERAWSTESFCGGFGDEAACVKIHTAAWVPFIGSEFMKCSGGMGGMWYR